LFAVPPYSAQAATCLRPASISPFSVVAREVHRSFRARRAARTPRLALRALNDGIRTGDFDGLDCVAVSRPTGKINPAGDEWAGGQWRTRIATGFLILEVRRI
jgi:hypothetical protein